MAAGEERKGRRRGISAPMDGQERTAVLGDTFQVREAVTQRSAGKDACATGTPDDPAQDTFQVREAVTSGEISAPPDVPPGESFQVREAVTQTLDPPHWAALRESAAAIPAPEAVAPADTEPPAPLTQPKPREPEAAPPAQDKEE